MCCITGRIPVSGCDLKAMTVEVVRQVFENNIRMCKRTYDSVSWPEGVLLVI